MKASLKIILLFLAICLPQTALSADKEKEEVVFSPGIAKAISEYKGTAPVVLPKMEKRDLIERPVSAAPGRMVIMRNIVVNKDARRLNVVNSLGDTLMTYPVCSSRNRGQKKTKDDCRTPEGTFPLYGVYNSTDWTYENTTSKCYGPWFLSLRTPRYWGVGIHGTNAPGSVPGRSSHGCIRMHNESITRVKAIVQKDTRVTVLPDR